MPHHFPDTWAARRARRRMLLLIVCLLPSFGLGAVAGAEPPANVRSHLTAHPATAPASTPEFLDRMSTSFLRTALPGAMSTQSACTVGITGPPVGSVGDETNGGTIFFGQNDTYWTYLELRPDACAGCGDNGVARLSVAHLALYFPSAPETATVEVSVVGSVPVPCHFPNYQDPGGIICGGFSATLECQSPLTTVDFAIPFPGNCMLSVPQGGFGRAFLGFNFLSANDTTSAHKPQIAVQAAARACNSFNPVGFISYDFVSEYQVGNPVMYAEVASCGNAVDLTLSKRHGAALVTGQPSLYTLVVRNVGDAATAAPTIVTDTLPAGLSYAAASGAGWSFGVVGKIVSANFPASIAAGDSAKFTLAVVASPAAIPAVTNRATVFTAGDADSLNNFAVDPTEVVLAAPAYAITSVTDVGGDQGHKVRVRWSRESHDAEGSGTAMVSYSIWRRIAPNLVVSRKPEATRSNTAAAYPPGEWDYIKSVPAHGEASYSTTCETLCDSTIAHGPCWSVFFVRAESANPLVYFDTTPDSGSSVDNLPPAPPAALVGSYSLGATRIQWQPNGESDLWCYRIYRGTTADFLPAIGNMISVGSGAAHTDPGVAGRYYKVSAADLSGNESGSSLLAPSQTLGVEVGELREFRLDAVRPNPAHAERLSVTFALPSAAPAHIELLDVGGRRLETREVGTLGVGHHTVDFAGSRSLAPGLYLVRLTQGAMSRNVRVAVVE